MCLQALQFPFSGECVLGGFRKPRIDQVLCGKWDMKDVIGSSGHQYTFTLKMETPVFAETSENLHHSTRLIPKAEVTQFSTLHLPVPDGNEGARSYWSPGLGSQVRIPNTV
jgi:hypothetical protein